MFIWQVLEKYDDADFEQWYGTIHVPAIAQYLKLAEPHIKWFLPEGAPDTISRKKPSEAVSHLIAEWKVMKLFHSDEGGNDPYPTVHKFKRESKFVDTLENIPAIETDFLVAIKDKTVFDQYRKLIRPK